ncbi:unnamed protein product [Ceratitis capitata]|uniref:(Mediterranean fruit fly) hypothetical protein n=1 Tax=Ceratitis capitata TaxID=7213 RepID=A0A811UJZ5_CERCA|nr:unnamed protein product [Ceratitis capitata]
MSFALMRKANGYKPFLYNFTVDACKYMKKRNNPVINYFHSFFEKYSTINRTCPYGPQDELVDKLPISYVNHIATKVLPLPNGEYAFKTDWYFYNVKVALPLLRKANGYKPFLYNFTIDACRNLKKRSNPVVRSFHSWFEKYSTIIEPKDSNNKTVITSKDIAILKTEASNSNELQISQLSTPETNEQHHFGISTKRGVFRVRAHSKPPVNRWSTLALLELRTESAHNFPKRLRSDEGEICPKEHIRQSSKAGRYVPPSMRQATDGDATDECFYTIYIFLPPLTHTYTPKCIESATAFDEGRCLQKWQTMLKAS